VVVVRVDAADLAAVPACPLVGAVRRGERRDAVVVGEPLDGAFDLVGVHDSAQVLVVTLIAGAEAARGMVAAVEAVTDADGGRSPAVGGDAVEEDLDLEPPCRMALSWSGVSRAWTACPPAGCGTARGRQPKSTGWVRTTSERLATSAARMATESRDDSGTSMPAPR
jgi:hypothetical protein